MSSVVALLEEGWMDANTDRRMWTDLCRAYDVKLQLIEHFEEAVYVSGVPVVAVDETGISALDVFAHPKDAIYVFGRTHINLIQDIVPASTSVRIEYPVHPPCLFGVVAAAIVLEHRRQQWP